MKGFVNKPNNVKTSDGDRKLLENFGKKVRGKRLEVPYTQLELSKITNQVLDKIESLEKGKYKITPYLKKDLESILKFKFGFDNAAPFLAKVHKPIAVDSVKINGLRHKGWVTFSNQPERKTVAL